MLMHTDIQKILDTLLLNIAVLDDEILRLARCEQFTPTSGSHHTIDRIRDGCLNCLSTLRTAERTLRRAQPEPRKAIAADILPLRNPPDV